MFKYRTWLPAKRFEFSGRTFYYLYIMTEWKLIVFFIFTLMLMGFFCRYGNGILQSELNRIWKQEKAPLLDVDVQGGIHIQEQYPGKGFCLDSPENV